MTDCTFTNAHLFDPSTGLDETGGISVVDGIITDIGKNVSAPDAQDANGALLLPGLVDMRVFAGEPGFEYRETLATASEAAAAGGVTTMITMPNTDPVIDDVALVDFILRRARDTGLVRVVPMAALTKGLNGAEMTEFGLLKEAGAVAVTDGDRSIANSRVLRRAMSYAKDFGMLIVQHVEDETLAAEGVMHEGEMSARLGLPGIPEEAEVIMLERDMRLVELTGAAYHAAQISSAKSLEVIRTAKKRGLPVTCGVSINHLTLNEHDIVPYRTFFKLSPPLRSEHDRQELVAGLVDGSIDVIVSSHDPQNPDTKRLPFAEAEAGAIGLETLLTAAWGLHLNDGVPIDRIVAALGTAPAAICGLQAGSLAPGNPADFTLFDQNIMWNVEEAGIKSKSNNTPFEGRVMQGRVVNTVVGGTSVFALD
ncbi:MAG: dihydroorotase [Hyphomicrobiales bacterium]